MTIFYNYISLKVIGKIQLDDLCNVFITPYDYSGDSYVRLNVINDNLDSVRNEYRLYIRYISKLEREFNWDDDELWSGRLVVEGFLEIDNCLDFVLECLGYGQDNYQTELMKYKLIYDSFNENGEIKLSFVDYEDAGNYYKSVLMLLQNKRNEE